MVMELVSGLSLANHSDSASFLVVHALFNLDGCQREGFWEVSGQVVSPFNLSPTLPVGGGLLVPCSLPGPPVVKHACTWLLRCLARVGGFSQCASPDTIMGYFFRFPLASHSNLPGSQSIFGISQDPPPCAYTPASLGDCELFKV